MAGTENAQVKCSRNKVEGEDSSRTAYCLRGRLLAERLASRNAREEAEQLGIRVLEVERLLKQEAKSRKRAEKKLKFLVKKLECMNISYAADESEHSASSDKTSEADSSVSCRASSRIQKIENLQKNLFRNSEEINDSQLSLWSCSEMGSNENSNSSACEASDVSCAGDEPLHRMESSAGEEHADNLMALVPVDMALAAEDGGIEPEVLDATVKQVLESLRRAKEQLQSSMERRRKSVNMIKVG